MIQMIRKSANLDRERTRGIGSFLECKDNSPMYSVAAKILLGTTHRLLERAER